LILCLGPVVGGKAQEKAEIAPRIIGGDKSAHGNYPWMAALVDSEEQDIANGQFCGASLIHPWWVVTAAHCVVGGHVDDFDVVLNTSDLGASPSLRLPVSAVVVHPGFNDDLTIHDDIALLQLQSPANGIIPLGLIDDPVWESPGKIGRAIGWGNMSDELDDLRNVEYPDELRELDLPIVATSTVNHPDIFDGSVTDGMVAAGFSSPGKGTCWGDSGGPFAVWDGSRNIWIQVGITSWGSMCGLNIPYSVFVRISHYSGWIEEVIDYHASQWKSRYGVTDFNGDSDGDSIPDRLEFALDSNPLGPSFQDLPEPIVIESGNESYPALRYRRQKYPASLEYQVFASTDLANWNPLDTEANLVGDPEPMEEFMETATVRADIPAGDGQPVFLRLQVEDQVAYSPSTYRLGWSGSASGTLSAQSRTDPNRPGAYFSQDFRLVNHPAGQPLVVGLDNASLNGRLSIIDADTGVVLHTDESGGYWDRRVEFTTEAGMGYLVRVTTSGESDNGRFQLFTLPQLTGSAFALPGSRTGSLQNSDPVYPINGYVADTYILSNVPSATGVKLRLESGNLDGMIWVIDSATGEKLFVGDNEPTGVTEVFVFTPDSAIDYQVRVGHYWPNESGSYTLTASNFTEPSSIGTSDTLQSDFSETDDLFDVQNGTQIYADTFALVGWEDFDTIYITVTGLSDLFPVFAVFDHSISNYIAFAYPGFDRVAELSFTASFGSDYELRLLATEFDLGSNYRIDTHYDPDFGLLGESKVKSAHIAGSSPAVKLSARRVPRRLSPLRFPPAGAVMAPHHPVQKRP
jgi:hypothetical protein